MSSLPRLAVDSVEITANFLSKLLHQHRLIHSFIRRDLRSRYLGSILGILWGVIHPLVLLISYSFIFAVLFPPDLRDTHSSAREFVLLLFAGLLPWLYFQDTLQRASTSVLEHSTLIRKTVFPSEILPVVIAGSNIVTHLIGCALFLVVLVFFHGLSWHVLLLPIFVVLLVGLSLGLAWLVAALTVFLRDTSQLLIVLLILWFWFTPIFYRIELVEQRLPWLGSLLYMNPMTHVVDGYQKLLITHQLPELWTVGALACFAGASLAAGGTVFRVLKREFIDVL